MFLAKPRSTLELTNLAYSVADIHVQLIRHRDIC